MYHAPTKASIHLRAPFFPAALLAVLAACGNSPTGNSTAAVAHVDQETFEFYYSEAEKRGNLWFCGERVPGRNCAAMPGLPPAAQVFARVRFVEEEPLGQTCYYNRDTNTITVPADKWDSGCVPHEVLHASLEMMGDRCWRDIEHRPYDGGC